IYDDFTFTEVGKYFIAARTVMTNLFKNPVYMTVTATNLDIHKGYRLFLSTINHEKLYAMFCSNAKTFNDDSAQVSWLLPLRLYSLRWNIEVIFYELKSFWSFGNYMLRSKQGIENFINIISISYACAKLIPFADDFFSDFAHFSTQTTKYAFGEAIRKELFFTQFVDFLETRNISLQNLHNFDFSDFFAHSS
ncbi:MAG: transposase, partial [Firmicutes bacterium]|nr:transposase [Bacillota bacterium]